MRLSRVLSLALALAFISAPAMAKTYNLPSVLGSKLGKLTKATPLPVLLPQSMPLDFSKKLYASVSGGSKSWAAVFAGQKNCGGANACFIAGVTGTKGGKASGPKKVKLVDGVTGYFQPLACGASCAPPSIQFKRSGEVIDIQAHAAKKGKTDRQILVAAANSAISSGPR